MQITLDDIQAHAPQDVRLVLMDESEVDVEIVFDEVEPDEMFCFSIIVPEELKDEEFKAFTVGTFPGKTSLRFPTLIGM